MTARRIVSALLAWACLGASALDGRSAAAEPVPDAARLVAAIPLPDVRGRIDHLAIDEAGGRLFVAALGNDTLEVVDLRSGSRVRSIGGLHEPQGVLFLADRNQLWLTNGGDGACDVFDAATWVRTHTVALGDDADNLRGADGVVYAASGAGALTFIDATTAAVVGRVALPAHPESFQLERSGPRIFVNLPAAQTIAAVDRERRAVIATWPLVDGAANYPMALDEGRRRLFVGVRQPPRIDVYDIDSGARVAAVPCVDDLDDVFVDRARGRVLAIGGEGRVDVFAASGRDRYRRVGRIPTRRGARTGLWVEDANRLYVALPRIAQQPAEVRVYEPFP